MNEIDKKKQLLDKLPYGCIGTLNGYELWKYKATAYTKEQYYWFDPDLEEGDIYYQIADFEREHESVFTHNDNLYGIDNYLSNYTIHICIDLDLIIENLQ